MGKRAFRLPKPPTQRAGPMFTWIRVCFLSPYLRRFGAGDKTLDLACGWGFSFRINHDFWGIEIDDDCVAYLQRLGRKVTKGNILDRLPFEDEAFDNCFTHDVLEHFDLSDVETIFQNVRRVVRKGGMFMNIIPNERGYALGLRTGAGHCHNILPSEIERIAVATGFRVARIYSSPLPALFHRFVAHNKYVIEAFKE
jgi:SAM-dependent methyltransferase